MILIAHDGSADAQAAIDGAARLMPGMDATVLTVWLRFDSLLAGKSGVDGHPAAYVCEHYACQRPVTRAEDLAALLPPRFWERTTICGFVGIG